MAKMLFTPEEIEILRQNPYVLNVTSHRIVYTLAFKKLAVQEAANGMKSTEIFKRAGFDLEMLGKTRIYMALKLFQREAASPEGLRELREAGIKTKEERMAKFAQEDYSKKQTKVAIRELQKKVIHLEQQIEFLKKIQFPEE